MSVKKILPTLDWLTTNEEKTSMTHDDYSTGELELTVLPSLMAYFEDKLSTNGVEQRKERLQRMVVLYKFYLAIYRNLHLNLPDGKPLGEEEEGDNEQGKSAEFIRGRAIANFQWQKNLFAKIEDQSAFEFDSDTGRRKRAVDMLHYWVYKSQREIDMIQKELKLLSSMLSGGSVLQSATSAPRSQIPVYDLNINNLRSVREALQNQVFGRGYPSAPLMTPGEWFDNKQIEDAKHRLAHPPPPPPRPRQEGEETDSEEEEEKRQTAIRMDAYRDVHRRGEGNTYRRG